MNAVITAGGRIDGEYARRAATSVKALAQVRGRSMLDRVVEAARSAGCERIAVVGGADVAAACARLVDRVFDESSDGAENVLRALGAWPQDEPLLYLASDLPYASAAAIRDFVGRSTRDAVSMPICTHAAFCTRFPGAPPAGITLAGERIVNGGAFLLPPGGASAVAAFASRFFRARKSPLKMARLLGPAMLLRFALGRLSIGALEAYGTRAIGIGAQAVRDASPELAFDADTADEFAYASVHA